MDFVLRLVPADFTRFHQILTTNNTMNTNTKTSEEMQGKNANKIFTTDITETTDNKGKEQIHGEKNKEFYLLISQRNG